MARGTAVKGIIGLERSNEAWNSQQKAVLTGKIKDIFAGIKFGRTYDQNDQGVTISAKIIARGFQVGLLNSNRETRG